MTITREQIRAVSRRRVGRKPTLNREQVKAIRETALNETQLNYAGIAERFGVSVWLVNQVCQFRHPYDYEI